MTNQPGGRRWRNGLILITVLAGGLSAVGLTLAANPNEREVKPAPNVQDVDEIYDKDGNPKADSKVWVLDFKFLDPRLIKVDVPGSKGQKSAGTCGIRLSTRRKKEGTYVLSRF